MKVSLATLSLLFACAFIELNCGGGPSTHALNAVNTASNSATSVRGATVPWPSGTTGNNDSSTGNTPSGTSTSGSSSSSGSSSNSGTSSSSGSGASSSAEPPPAQASIGTTLTNLQQNSGWLSFAELAPSYVLCRWCSPKGPQVTWSMNRGVSSPSMSGSATEFSVGGNVKYSDVIWINHLIGDLSTQGIEDHDHSINEATHNFIYDAYFWGTESDFSKAEALEFDINQYVDGKSFIWGTQCRVADGNWWDISVDGGMHWQPTSTSCNPVPNAWNHVVIQVQRTSDDQLLFQTITLNSKTATLNYLEDPGHVIGHGVTINYQQDGDHSQQKYSIYLDQLNFTYW